MISIIVPVHNAESTLARCLESVLQQSHADLEVVCVENGSSDGSWELLQTYGAKDPRVKCHRLVDVSSVTRARNHGLDHAAGEHVFFLDADDWLDNNCLQDLWEHASRANARLVVGGWKEQPSGTEYPNKPRTVRPGRPNYFDHSLMSVVWGRLFDRAMIGDLRFLEAKIGEDAVFMLAIALRAPVIQFVGTMGYNYLVHPASATSQILKRPRYLAELFGYPSLGLPILDAARAGASARKAWIRQSFYALMNWGARIDSEDVWDAWRGHFAELRGSFPLSLGQRWVLRGLPEIPFASRQILADRYRRHLLVQSQAMRMRNLLSVP